MAIGRPWKYKPLVQALDGNTLYPVSRIIRESDERGLFEYDLEDTGETPFAPAEKKRAKRNARAALANMAPKLGKPDGEVEVAVPYRAFFPAWLGSTWKKMIRE